MVLGSHFSAAANARNRKDNEENGMEFGKGFFVALFAILLSLTVVLGPGAGASGAMDCSTAAFQALPLFDEQFGKPVMGLTATPVAADAEAPAYCDVQGTMWPEIK